MFRSQLFGRETISGGIQNPGVVVGAFHACEEPDGLAREFPGCEGARVRKGAVWLSFHVAFLLPFLEVPE